MNINSNHQNSSVLLSTYAVYQGAEAHFLYVTPHKPCGEGVVMIAPILELEKLRPSKVQSLAQGRVATKRQR